MTVPCLPKLVPDRAGVYQLVGPRMRVALSVILVGVAVSIGGCARKPQATYVELPPVAPQSSASEAAQEHAGALRNEVAASRKHWAPSVAADHSKDIDGKYLMARAKAERVGVERLTQADIEGLTFDQIQQLRGY